MKRAVTYCVVPRELAAKLHEPLRRHFGEDPSVEVIVERRELERRRASDRRKGRGGRARGADRRSVRAAGGRRVGERRADLVPVEAPPLPRKARAHAERLLFVRRLEPSGLREEDLDSARLVARYQAGEDAEAAVSTLYLRYFGRVHSYLTMATGDRDEAEDLTQSVFVNVLEDLPHYEQREQPFRAWLFKIARNRAIDHLRKHERLEVMDPDEIDRRREAAAAEEPEPLDLLHWISDRELSMFVERLPQVQRQVLFLNYVAGMTSEEIGEALGQTATNVRSLQHRAVVYLRKRLAAVRGPREGDRPANTKAYVRQAPVLRMRRFSLDP